MDAAAMTVIDRPRAGRAPSISTKAKPLPRFVPVIFANGVDDDLPGIAAAMADEAVQYDGVIREPGEPVVVSNCTSRLCVDHIHFISGGAVVFCADNGLADAPLELHMAATRLIVFDHVAFIIGKA